MGTQQSNIKHYICEIIMLVLMFGGFFMPEIESLPPYGVQLLFIFIGLLFGWSTVGLIIPSLLGLTAMAFTSGFTIKSVWSMGFGSDIIVLLVLFCIFSKWLEKVGFTRQAILRDAAIKNGRVIDMYYYDLIKREI